MISEKKVSRFGISQLSDDRPDSGFGLMSRASEKRKIILSDFCAELHCQSAAWILHKSHPPQRMSNLGYGTLSQPAVFAWRNTYFSAEDLSEMAWASVTNVECYLDYASLGLPQQAAGFLQS